MTHGDQQAGNIFLRRAAFSAISGAFLGALLPGLIGLFGNLLNSTEVPASSVGTIVARIAKHLDLITEAALVGALAGTFWFLYRNRHRAVREPDLTRERLANLFETYHNPDFKTRLPIAPPDLMPSSAQSETLRTLLMELGILKTERGAGTPVSELADAFLCSVTAFLHESRDNFVCYWSSYWGSAEYDFSRDTLRRIEETRIGGRLWQHVPVARKVRSGLALIRMDIAGQPNFLMIESRQWGPEAGWWFVGGTEEPKDGGDLATTVRREVNEELGMSEDDAVLDCSLLFPPSMDVRLSGRYGILTEYAFHMFAVRLKGEHPKIKPLLQVQAPDIQIPLKEAVRVHRFQWLTWNELIATPHLRNYTPYLVNEIEQRLTPDQIPVTAAIS
jgi:8-oxo-dGTP pyrophosphatase MutT (NUDIX family)